MINLLAISHADDVDGLVCASLLKMGLDSEYTLVDYSDLPIELKRIPNNVNTLYICDLSIDNSIINQLRTLCKSMKVTYIDHHPSKPEITDYLKTLGVNLIHSNVKCAGVMTYELLKKKLPENASVLATYAALSDYPYVDRFQRLSNEKLDAHILTLESELLYYAVAKASNDKGFKRKVVDELSKLKFPHEIKNVVACARDEIRYLTNLARNIDNETNYMRNLAYVKVKGSTGVAANALVHYSKKPILVCYGHYRGGAYCHLSIRSKSTQYGLDNVTADAAEKLGGSGGGHPQAAAARLRTEDFAKFVELIDREFDRCSTNTG